MSPAQRSFARKTAARLSARSAGPASAATALAAPTAQSVGTDDRQREYELQRAALGQDLGVLKNIQSISAKIEAKAAMLPKYDPWVDGVIEAAVAAEAAGKLIGQDDVLVETMIWAIDCTDHVRAMPRVRAFFRNGMKLPQRFDRTPGCLVAEEFAETALKAMSSDKAHIADVFQLSEIAQITEDHDMPDPVRAKLHKAIGMAIERATDAAEDGDIAAAGGKKRAYETARHAYTRALTFDEKSGVKKRIERLESQIKKLAEPSD